VSEYRDMLSPEKLARLSGEAIDKPPPPQPARKEKAMSMPDCVSAQGVSSLAQLQAVISSKRAEIKQELMMRLESTIVEVPMAVLAELMELAHEAQEAREEGARRGTRQPKQIGSRMQSPDIEKLIAEGLSAREIVEKIGLPRTFIGPLAARIKRVTAGGAR